MESDLPKVLHPLCEKPLILHIIESLKKTDIGDIFVIVGYRGEMVIDAVRPYAATCVWQHEQLGTGHAVMQAETSLERFEGRVIVANGDVPLIRPATFQRLIDESDNERVKAVVLTMKLDNPTGYGRIVKDQEGDFLCIAEEKDATPEQKLIHEVNTGIYIFDKRFLFDGLHQITTNNAQREYYLPDALQHIIRSKYRVQTVCLENAREGSGVNTKKELAELEAFVASGKIC